MGKGSQFLTKPFQFYGFGITVSLDSKIDLLGRALVKYYQKTLIDVGMQREHLDVELE